MLAKLREFQVIIDFMCYEQRKTAVSPDIVVEKKSHLKGS